MRAAFITIATVITLLLLLVGGFWWYQQIPPTIPQPAPAALQRLHEWAQVNEPEEQPVRSSIAHVWATIEEAREEGRYWAQKDASLPRGQLPGEEDRLWMTCSVALDDLLAQHPPATWMGPRPVYEYGPALDERMRQIHAILTLLEWQVREAEDPATALRLIRAIDDCGRAIASRTPMNAYAYGLQICSVAMGLLQAQLATLPTTRSSDNLRRALRQWAKREPINPTQMHRTFVRNQSWAYLHHLQGPDQEIDPSRVRQRTRFLQHMVLAYSSDPHQPSTYFLQRHFRDMQQTWLLRASPRSRFVDQSIATIENHFWLRLHPVRISRHHQAAALTAWLALATCNQEHLPDPEDVPQHLQFWAQAGEDVFSDLSPFLSSQTDSAESISWYVDTSNNLVIDPPHPSPEYEWNAPWDWSLPTFWIIPMGDRIEGAMTVP